MPWSLKLENDSGRALTPYPVDPGPPPQRIEDAANAVPNGGSATIDVEGFNPAYIYAPLPQVPGQPNGLVVQMDLQSPDPGLLVITFQYRVAPGQESGDPAQQPVKVTEYPFTGLSEGAYALVLEAGLLNVRLDPIESGSSGSGCGVMLLPWICAACWRVLA